MRHCVNSWDCYQFGPLEILLVVIVFLMVLFAIRSLM